jgi:hypothetical protein
LSGRLNKPQIRFRTLPLKPPLARQAGNEVGLETWCEQTQRRPSDRLAPSGDLFDTNLVSTYRDRVGFVRGTRETLRALQQPLAGARGTPMKIVAACEAAITPVAVRQGASEIYTVGAGRSRWTRAGAEAPIEVRVLYKGLTGYEAHQARISCALDKGGQVQALSTH